MLSSLLAQAATLMRWGLRIEHLLSVAVAQREQHVARLASRNDARADAASSLIFHADDMREIMNEWRKQPRLWVEPETLEHASAMQSHQAYRQGCKRRLSTMLFQLFGNKALVEIFIRFPICSAEHPASTLKSFAVASRPSHGCCLALAQLAMVSVPRMRRRCGFK